MGMRQCSWSSMNYNQGKHVTSRISSYVGVTIENRSRANWSLISACAPLHTYSFPIRHGCSLPRSEIQPTHFNDHEILQA